MKFKTDGDYIGGITLSEGFVRQDMKTLDEQQLKIYLLALMFAETKQKAEIKDIADILQIPIEDVVSALKELEKKTLISLSTTAITLKAPHTENTTKRLTFKEYTPEEIADMDDKDVDKIVRCAEKTYGKLLSYAEISTIISLYKFLSIPREVLIILIEYTGALGRKTMSYLKTAAMDWHERGIDSPKKAHEHITYLEQQKNYYAQMKELFGIYGREFTKKEKEFLDKWAELKFTAEEIKESYEKTIDSTGKISFAYMNKILTSDDVEFTQKQEQKPRKKVKPTGFNNFTARNRDYDDIKAKAREKLKKRAEELKK